MTTASALTFTVGIRTVNLSNRREHWTARHRRVQRERDATAFAWPRAQRPGVPCEVWMVRVAPARNQLDSDGPTAAVKTIRDEVARLLGVDDGDPRVVWHPPTQEKGEWGVRVTVVWQEGAEVLPARARPSPRNRARVGPPGGLLGRAQKSAGFAATPSYISPRKKP